MVEIITKKLNVSVGTMNKFKINDRVIGIEKNASGIDIKGQKGIIVKVKMENF